MPLLHFLPRTDCAANGESVHQGSRLATEFPEQCGDAPHQVIPLLLTRWRLGVTAFATMTLLLLTGAAGAAPARAETVPDWPELFLTAVVERGLANPVHVTHAGDGSGRLFVSEKGGRIRVIKDGVLLSEPFLDISARTANYSECGLLSVAFPDDYADSGHFFVYYNYDVAELGDLVPPEREDIPNDGCDTVVARFRVTDDPDVADAESEERLLIQNQPYGNHDGGQIAFGPDGYLYIGLGDGGAGGDPHNLAQDPAILLGKILRIEVGAGGPYAVPADNPFVGQEGARPEIWAVGLRNPWRFSFDRGTGSLYIADVGQNSYEEVNVQPPTSTGGENYGWKIMEGTHCYPESTECERTGLTLPVIEYDRTQGFSVTGGFVYRGPTYPRMADVYFYGDFGNGRIWGLRRDDADWENALLLETAWDLRLVSFGEDQEGELYVVDFGGGLYRLGDTLNIADLTEKVYLPLLSKAP